ncbi:hypothetical protein MGA5115_00992 [Marinomonas gallaica]|uniref:Uncharacterized protein n=1 Tax=Marinomonas gallaica TaxID=1806667 RepID=A0A1C3JP01_9GAMM|nr:hypothetical protein [Marinomonas gallaica]SBT16906.1 hypothetical protein MGA5115_00992 [Marinomonas gallaica]SBT22143.1 hypothetical protein MGA5116_02756 [Marinomonas gallaica]
MKFGLVDRQGYVPDMKYGETGQELSCFVPSDYTFEQVSYVNGEGEVKVDGHVWRFFFGQEGVGVELMSGIVTLTEAQKFLQDVKTHIWGDTHQQVQVFLSGVTVD